MVRVLEGCGFFTSMLLLSLIFVAGSACVKHPKNPLVQACQEENIRLKIDLTQKNERLRKFNQLNDKNELREQH